MNLHSKANSKLERFYKDLLMNCPEFFEGILKKKPRSHSPQKKHLDDGEKQMTSSKGSKKSVTIPKQAVLGDGIDKKGVLSASNSSKKMKSSSTEKDFRKRFQLMLKSPIDSYCSRRKERSLSNEKNQALAYQPGKIAFEAALKKRDNLTTPVRRAKNGLKNKNKSHLSLDFNRIHHYSSKAITSPIYNKRENHSKKEVKTTTQTNDQKNKVNTPSANLFRNKKENVKSSTHSPSIWKSIQKINKQKLIKEQLHNLSKEYSKKNITVNKSNNLGLIKKPKSKDHSDNVEPPEKKPSLTSTNPLSIPQSKPKVCRRIAKMEILSKPGYGGPGDVKVNQDNYFIFKHLNDETSTYFIGVCDGHGLTGHDISKFLTTHLPKKVHEELKATNKYISNKETRNKALKEAFKRTNEQLCQTHLIDTKYSGSTCASIILKKSKVISANLGDSRAVLGRFMPQSNTWKAIDLTRDHKPSDLEESERILKHGGRIEPYKDDNDKSFGPPRIWLKDEDVPGLAMSRSFGDKVAATVGTTSEPEIKDFKLTQDDKFLLVASDGIWEYISIKDYYMQNDINGCLSFLWNESSKRWIKEEERIDDITCVLIFFENN